MTYKEEKYILNSLQEIQETIRGPEFTELVKETHENNIMLRQIIAYINMTIKNSPNEEMQDFFRNVLADMFCSKFK